MEMIERYLYEVSRRLPMKQRKDIEEELRSLILDNLEDRTTKEPTKQDIEAVLLELGPPVKVAASYRGTPRYLIGPEVYDLYILVLKILIGVTAGGLLIAHVLSLFSGDLSGSEMLASTGKFLLNVLMTSITVVGWITIIFASIQLSKKNAEVAGILEEDEWHPSKLPVVPDKKERVKPFEMAIGISITVILLALFNLFPDKVGIYYMVDGVWSMVSLFSLEAMAVYVPMWSVLWVLSLVQQVWLLRDGQWKRETHIFDIALSLLKIGVLAYMISGPALFAQTLISETMVPALEPLLKLLPTLFDVFFSLAIVGLVINIITKAIKLVNIRIKIKS